MNNFFFYLLWLVSNDDFISITKRDERIWSCFNPQNEVGIDKDFCIVEFFKLNHNLI